VNGVLWVLAATPIVTPPPPDAAELAAKDTTTPLPVKTQLKFKPMYTFPRGRTREKARLQFEAVLPYRGAFVPDLAVDDIESLARIQITGESIENERGTAGGLEDLTFFDLAVRRFGALDIGAGFGSVFPLATSPELGNGKWQLGPALGSRVETIEALHLGVLTQALWSVAGSSASPEVAYVSVQPFLALHLPSALIVSSDATMKFFWAGGHTNVPINLGFGHAFSEHFVGTVKWEVTIAGTEQGAQKGELSLNFRP
jgi:hypothetical protein